MTQASLRKHREAVDAAALPYAAEAAGMLLGADNVRVAGDEIDMINTGRGDTDFGAFKFNAATGMWADFATDAKGNGVVSLVAYLLGGADEKTATNYVDTEVLPMAAHSAPRAKKTSRKAELVVLDIQPKAESEDDTGDDLPTDVHPKLGYPSATYRYTTDKGETAFYVYRFDVEGGGKETRPLSWSAAKNEWVWKYPPAPWPPYRTGKLDSDSVLVVEGEKAADAAAAEVFKDMLVVTSASGSANAHKTDWGVLKDKTVYLSPDHDEPGMKYALSVAGFAYVEQAEGVHIATNHSDLGWAEGDDLADHVLTARLSKYLVDMDPIQRIAIEWTCPGFVPVF